MSNINDAKLVAQGRMKAIGIPWNEEELKAIYQLKIPADYVRQGILTVEDYQKQKAEQEKTGEKPLYAKSIRELMKIAEGLKIKFLPSVNRETLIREIETRTVIGGPKVKAAPKHNDEVDLSEAKGSNGDAGEPDLEGEVANDGSVGDGSESNESDKFLSKGKKPEGKKEKKVLTKIKK